MIVISTERDPIRGCGGTAVIVGAQLLRKASSIFAQGLIEFHLHPIQGYGRVYKSNCSVVTALQALQKWRGEWALGISVYLVYKAL